MGSLPPNPLTEHAQAYVRRGWPVLPLWWPAAGHCACGSADCHSAGKHPIWHLVPQGLNDATTDPGIVDAWWSTFPRANIGVRTGAESGVVVLDIDGEVGRQMLRGLTNLHGPLDAVWARSGSGGWHAYMAHPGTRVPNSAGRTGDGLDVRGDGGYVVAPPSRHASALRYRWLQPRDENIVLRGQSLPAMPAWLLWLAVPSDPEPPSRRTAPAQARIASAYASAAVEQEALAVAQAQPGHRNETLIRAAFNLGQLVAVGLLAQSTVTEILVAAALSAGPDERKIRATVKRGLDAGRRNPRAVRDGSSPEVSQPRPPEDTEPSGTESGPC